MNQVEGGLKMAVKKKKLTQFEADTIASNYVGTTGNEGLATGQCCEQEDKG
jgi:hypothetical protein